MAWGGTGKTFLAHCTSSSPVQIYESPATCGTSLTAAGNMTTTKVEYLFMLCNKLLKHMLQRLFKKSCQESAENHCLVPNISLVNYSVRVFIVLY